MRYLLDAVCADRGIGAALASPCANAEAMSLHLAEISRHADPKKMLLYGRRANQRTLDNTATGKLARHRIGQIDKLEVSE